MRVNIKEFSYDIAILKQEKDNHPLIPSFERRGI